MLNLIIVPFTGIPNAINYLILNLGKRCKHSDDPRLHLSLLNVTFLFKHKKQIACEAESLILLLQRKQAH